MADQQRKCVQYMQRRGQLAELGERIGQNGHVWICKPAGDKSPAYKTAPDKSG
ncbi:MAG: hypothetical protein IAF02_12045 [Anaerolineae bacterium]|nr:hypothetical protein [Anaerolineae bacterium]